MKTLDINDFSPDPFTQFNKWYSCVFSIDRVNSNAMSVSTSSLDGRVSSRVVLLKEWSSDGFIFYTSYESKKGRQVAENPNASLLFYWPDQGRQVRIEGRIVRTSTAVSDAYFESRSRGHKANAIVSKQSSVIENPEDILAGARYLIHSGDIIQRPASWGGYRVDPCMFEFWQAGENRFNDRVEYVRENGKWIKRRLAP